MVSIVIPTFNRRSFLLQAVESVLSQNFADFELIIADDGSTDDSCEAVLQAYPDSRIRYLRLEHRGVSAARNRGISSARYEWVTFLDSDDRWVPSKLQRQLELLDQMPHFPIAYTNEIWIRNGRRVNQKKIHQKYGGWIYQRCLPLCLISPSSVILQKDLFKTFGGFDETLPVCEDYELWLRLTARCPVLFIDEPLIVKTGGHPDQLSKSRWGMDRYRIRALIGMYESGKLSPWLKNITAREIVRKASILAAGFSNRKKEAEARHYLEIVQRFDRGSGPPSPIPFKNSG